MTDADLSPEEAELIDAANSDDIDMFWAMDHLGIIGDDYNRSVRPSLADVDRTFEVIRRLVGLGLLRVGSTAYVDGGPPGRLSPVYFVDEPLDVVRDRVASTIVHGDDLDWRFAGWLVAP